MRYAKEYSYLIGKTFGGLEVISYNAEKTAELHGRKAWNCKCKVCGKILPVQERTILKNRDDCGCRRYLKASDSISERTIEKRMEHSQDWIGVELKYGSVVLSVHTQPSKNTPTIYNIRCGICGEIYQANIYKLAEKRCNACPSCLNKIVGGRPSVDYTNQVVAGLEIRDKNIDGTFDCTDIRTGKQKDLFPQQIRKRIYDYSKKDIKTEKPFIYINIK